VKVPAESGEAKLVAVEPAEWDLLLYGAGLRHREHLCQAHPAGQSRMRSSTLGKSPQFARGDQILAVPAMVRMQSELICKIIGNLSNRANVVIGLDLCRRAAAPRGAGKEGAHAG